MACISLFATAILIGETELALGTIRVNIEMGQVAQAARHLATGWMAWVPSQVSEGVEIFRHSFMSKLVLESTQPPIK